jgi:hypothetical protein
MDSYIEKMETQLKAWSERFGKLAARAENADAGDFSAHIDELKRKEAAALSKVEELKAAGSGKWERFRAEIWITWNELENTLGDFQQSFLKRVKEKNEGNEKKQ